MRSRRRFRTSEPPPRPLSVGAIAVADRRANAVGLVRLVCQPNGLRVELLRVGRFAAGFTFAGLADAVSFRVPYTAVRGMVRDGHTLHLSLDERAAAPYSRFALARFSHDPLSAMMRTFRLRALASALSLALPLPVAATVAWALPRAYIGGYLGLGAAALVVVWVTYRALSKLVAWLSWGGPLADRLSAAFEAAVSAQLGLELATELSGAPAATAPAAAPPPATAGGALGAVVRPRRFALVGAVALLASLGAVLAVQRFGVAASVLLPVEEAASGVSSPVNGVLSRAQQAVTPLHPPCTCAHADSPLWRAGVPQLAIMVAPIVGELGSVWLHPGETYPITYQEAERPRAELDLAVVNNSDIELDEVDLVVTFARRGPQGKRRNLIERGLHWPGKLAPGEAVKWRVKATGTELKVDTRLDRRLGDGGLTVAPADRFVALQKARLQVVRLHGAMMLGYRGNPRAEQVARALDALGPLQERARGDILASLSPLVACDPRPAAAGMELCVRNGSDRLHRGLVLSELGRERGRRFVIRDLFFPGRALRVAVDIDPNDLPSGFAVEALDSATPAAEATP